MTSKERVHAAMHYRAVDKAPLQFKYSDVGYYEHGEKLNDLFATLPGDFEPFERKPIVGPLPHQIDENGRFHAFETDAWGVEWEKRIYGVAGIPCRYPLADPDALEGYRPPVAPVPGSIGFEALKAHYAQRNAGGFYTMHHCGGIYERLIALCGDENVLCGILMEDEHIEKVADMITENARKHAEAAVQLGVDAVEMGDDYGAERSLLMSPACWRRFFKPRLKYILEPAVRAGLDIHFHSCGMIGDILEDFRELGITSIWPQLPAFNMEELAKRCRELELAVAIHTDRANTMTFGTPQQVRDLVKREYDVFRMGDGGSWFFVEMDNDFPFENIQAQVETIAQWR